MAVLAAKGIIKIDLKTTASSGSSTSVFETGSLSVSSIHVDTSNIASPPKPLLIISPTVQGTYPVLLFLHGYELRNIFYSHLLRHISSHGFIVVAPQVLSLPILLYFYSYSLRAISMCFLLLKPPFR